MSVQNVFKLKSLLGLAQLSSPPTTTTEGFLYFDTTLHAVRVYASGSWSTAGKTEFTDGEFKITKTADATAKIAISAAAITASTTRTITMPNADVDLGALTNSNIAAAAGIVESKLTLDYSTSSLNTAIGGKVAKAGDTMSGNLAMGGNKVTGLGAPTANGDALRYDQLGANSGIATLDSGGKVPTSQLPNSVMEYKGNYDPTASSGAGSPALADGTGSAGDVYRVSVAGSHDFGSGAISFVVGDYVIYNGTVWEKSHSGADSVVSVNSKAGIVTLVTDDIAEGVTPTNKWFTDARAKAAAVLNTLAGSETDQAPSVSSVNSALSGKVATSVTVNGHALTGNVTVTKGDVSLGNVDDVQQLPMSYLDTDTALAANSDSKVASQKATKAYADTKLATVSADTAPQLGGNLDLNGKVLKGIMKLGDASANFMEQEYMDAITLTASQTAAVCSALTFAFASFEGVIIEYKIKEATTGAVRIGKLMISADAAGNIGMSDSLSETADVGVEWTAAVNSTNIEIKYTTTANAKAMKCLVKRIKA